MAVVEGPPAPHTKTPHLGDEEDDEPRTEPRPDQQPPAPRRAREGTMELPTTGDAEHASVGRTLFREASASPLPDDARRVRARTVMIPEHTETKRGGTLAMPNVPDARALEGAPDQPSAAADASPPRPEPRHGGTDRIPQVEPAPASEAQRVTNQQPRPRAATLKSPESAAELAALRRQYAGVIRMPEIGVEAAAADARAPEPETPAGEEAPARPGTMELDAVSAEPQGTSTGGRSVLSDGAFSDDEPLADSESFESDDLGHHLDEGGTFGDRDALDEAARASAESAWSEEVEDWSEEADAEDWSEEDDWSEETAPRGVSVDTEDMALPSQVKAFIAGERGSPRQGAPGFGARHRAPSASSLGPAAVAGAPPEPLDGSPPAAPHDPSDPPPSRADAASDDDLAVDSDSSDGETPPKAMRPIGRLGGDDAIGLSLDFRPGRVVDPDEEPPSQRPPPLPLGDASEADRLDAWLDHFDDDFDPMAATVPPTRLPGTVAASAMLPREELPFVAPPLASPAPVVVTPPSRWRHDAQAQKPHPLGPRPKALTVDFTVAAKAPALPFAVAPPDASAEASPSPAPPPVEPAAPAFDDDSEADRLELWLRGHLDERAPAANAAPLPVPLPAGPPPEPIRAIAPNPIADATRPPPIAAGAREPPRPADSRPPLLPVHTYAQIKLLVWDRGRSLLQALEEHDIEEPLWRENELRMAEALLREARDGQAILAASVRQAIRTLRRDMEGDDGELLPLERYAEVRVALEGALIVDEAEELVLARHDLTPEAWEQARAGWTKRARRDAAVAREARRAVARARRAAKRRREAERAGANTTPP